MLGYFKITENSETDVDLKRMASKAQPLNNPWGAGTDSGGLPGQFKLSEDSRGPSAGDSHTRGSG